MALYDWWYLVHIMLTVPVALYLIGNRGVHPEDMSTLGCLAWPFAILNGLVAIYPLGRAIYAAGMPMGLTVVSAVCTGVVLAGAPIVLAYQSA